MTKECLKDSYRELATTLEEVADCLTFIKESVRQYKNDQITPEDENELYELECDVINLRNKLIIASGETYIEK